MPPRHPDIAHALGPVRSVLRRARQAEGLSPQQPLRLLVACSGGRDSIALLGLLCLIAEADRVVLEVGHVDHGLRSASADEARHVAAVAAGLGVRVATTRLELDPQAAGLPARARDARHQALERFRQAAGAHRTALAHTATDQAETVLLHLTRGAGLPGLAAMAHVEGSVVRPLLDVPRAATGPLCEHLGLAYVDDPTNLDPVHPRVRIRERVLPELSELRGGIEAALAASARAAREADEALGVWTERERAAREEDGPRWNLTGWRGLPRAVRVGTLMRIAAHAGVPRDGIGRRTLDQIDQGLIRGGGKRWALGGGRSLVSDGRHLWLTGDAGLRTPPEDST